jgi:hypothetical protein
MEMGATVVIMETGILMEVVEGTRTSPSRTIKSKLLHRSPYLKTLSSNPRLHRQDLSHLFRESHKLHHPELNEQVASENSVQSSNGGAATTNQNSPQDSQSKNTAQGQITSTSTSTLHKKYTRRTGPKIMSSEDVKDETMPFQRWPNSL